MSIILEILTIFRSMPPLQSNHVKHADRLFKIHNGGIFRKYSQKQYINIMDIHLCTCDRIHSSSKNSDIPSKLELFKYRWRLFWFLPLKNSPRISSWYQTYCPSGYELRDEELEQKLHNSKTSWGFPKTSGLY